MAISLEELIRRSVNRIGDVHPWIKESAIEIITRAYQEGIYVQFSSGYRSNEDQAWIYGQGRPSYVWNGKKYGTAGAIVSNAKPGTSVHNYRLALDYFLVSEDGKQSLWTVNDKWRRVAAIAKSFGYEWGGDWKSFVDYPHIQFTRGLSIAQLAAGSLPTFPQIVKKEVAGVSEQKLNASQEKLLNEAKRLKLTDGREPFGEVNRMYLFSVIVGLAQQVEELKKKVK
ncbi:M15 family metallopeptidase [Psychrobacillus sp. NPDC093180]|uniref:M15 family metallopeptidase n=1 Tax=Psychrobacillus sp. NPDC093180 TaxID=3364489 RepID=UPI00382115D5